MMKFKKYFPIVFLALVFISSCKKDSPAAITYAIQGLWVGTYTNTMGTFFFSFSIYPDGSLSYKSKDANNVTYFADGSYALNGTTFTFSVLTINAPTTQDIQTGAGTFSSSKGTLTNGTGSDQAAGTNFTWTMTRAN